MSTISHALMPPLTSYARKRVLVTGAGGFIGGALARRLTELGAIVVAPTRAEADFADAGVARRVVAEAAPDSIFNAASTTDTRRDDSIADEVERNTYGIATAVIDAAVEAKVSRFIQFGTIEEYGTNPAPFLETMPEAPVSPYSRGKAQATHYALAAGKQSGMSVTVVRPAATYGPAQKSRMLTPNIMRAALLHESFPMNDGTQERDLIYIDDVVEGILAVGLADNLNGEIVNLGNGAPYLVRDIARAAQAAMGGEPAIEFGAVPERPNEVKSFYMDSTKAYERLGWKATTTLEKGMRETAAWYRAHPDFFIA